MSSAPTTSPVGRTVRFLNDPLARDRTATVVAADHDRGTVTVNFGDQRVSDADHTVWACNVQYVSEAR